MPEINPHVAAVLDEVLAIRHDIHSHPEEGLDCARTAEIAAKKLEEYGCDAVTRKVGVSGVVAEIRGRRPGKAGVGFRADMDALPLLEISGCPWSSVNRGWAHSCGHDGHVAWALAVAKALCEERDGFAGSAFIIIQPGEEGYAGAREMVRDGLFERWDMDEVYAGHGCVDLDLGDFGLARGPSMAAADLFRIQVNGRGGHGGRPHLSIDPIAAAASLVQEMQQIVSRGINPMHPAVVSVCSFNAGTETGYSVIPDSVRLTGTTRCLYPEDRDTIERRMREVCEGVARSAGVKVGFEYVRMYSPLANGDEAVDAAAAAAAACAGAEHVTTKYPASMGAEDFSFMLERKPGAYIRVGMRDAGHVLPPHNPAFDFNDRCLPLAATIFVRLIEDRLNFLAGRRV